MHCQTHGRRRYSLPVSVAPAIISTLISYTALRRTKQRDFLFLSWYIFWCLCVSSACFSPFLPPLLALSSLFSLPLSPCLFVGGAAHFITHFLGGTCDPTVVKRDSKLYRQWGNFFLAPGFFFICGDCYAELREGECFLCQWRPLFISKKANNNDSSQAGLQSCRVKIKCCSASKPS